MKHPLTSRDITYIAVFAALISVCAWISIPAAVPITLQTFAVFLTVFLLGGRRGALCITVYLFLGAIGLPVFSFFRGGFGTLLGASGGYLLGFLPAALVMWAAERWYRARPWAQFLSAIPALCLCYAVGTIWYLSFYYEGAVSPAAVLSSCVFPFILPDMLKLSLAVFLSNRLKNGLKPHFPSGHL